MGIIINSYNFASVTPTPTPSSTPAVIITSGLTLQYDFDNSSSYPGTGTVLTDLSPSGNNGTLVNGPVFTSTSPKYLTFDGTNDRIDVGSSLTSTDWTIDMWLRKTSNQGANFDRIWGMGSYRFEIALDTNNNIRFYDSGWSTTTININTTWNNLVFAFRNDNGSGIPELKIYLNNSLQQTTVDGRTFASSSLKIGTSQFGSEAATFDLNEVRLYNRQLSSTEITTNYNARAGRFSLPTPTPTPTPTLTPVLSPTPTPSPVPLPPQNSLELWLDANNASSYPGSGTVWYDISGNGNDATLINGPTYSNGTILFDGSNDYSTYNYDASAAMTIITIGYSRQSTWSNFAGLGSSRTANGFIVHNDSGSLNVRYYVVSSAGGYTLIDYVYPASVNVMRMYAMSTNGTNSHKTYLDGSLVGTNTTSISRGTSTNNTGTLARDSTLTRYNFVGIRAHLIYNRQLSDAEITQIYNYYFP